MKKSLLALAVAAAIPAVAQAQSNVTLYGIVDTGVEYLNGDAAVVYSANNTTTNAVGAVSTTGQAGLRMQDTSNSWQGSRFGVRGVEPLGNSGMSAVFQIEHRFSVDNGAPGSSSQFWNGLASVGLRGSFGELTMGRQYTPGMLAWAFSDFTGNSGYQNWAAISTPGYSGHAAYGAIRADNSVMLTSTLGGLTVRAMVSMGEADRTGAAAPATLQHRATSMASLASGKQRRRWV